VSNNHLVLCMHKVQTSVHQYHILVYHLDSLVSVPPWPSQFLWDPDYCQEAADVGSRKKMSSFSHALR